MTNSKSLPLQFGRYLLVKKLAEGGMAEIFKAKTTGAHGFEKTLVVKRILAQRADHPEFVEMFISEAKVMVQLNHPKIVDVLDFGQIDGRYYIAMEYVKGIDCAQLLCSCATKRVRPSPVIAVHIVADILDALHYAHHLTDENGHPLKIVHRDVSPSNVFISEHGEVKLSDFGIATIGTRRGRSETGIVRGKYGYLAPEVVTGGPVDQRADVFSTGILLAELLMVQRLFYSENYMDILLQVRDANLERLDQYGKHISTELREILDYALAKNPALRYQTAGAFRNALNHYLFNNQKLLRSTSVRRFIREIKDETKSASYAGVPAESVPQSEKTTEPAVVGKASASGTTKEDLPKKKLQGLRSRLLKKRRVLQPPPTLDPLPPGKSKKAAIARLSGKESVWMATPVEDGAVDEVSQFMAPKSLEPIPEEKMEDGESSQTIPPEQAAKAHLTTSSITSLPEADFEGDLEEESLFSVLFTLAVDMETGLLLLKRGEEVKEVYLQEGDPYFIASNRPDELFGQYLLSRKVITREELEKALAILPRYKGKLGETLVVLKVLRPMQMLRLLTTQVRHKVFQAFTWETGAYSYYRGRICQKDAVPLGLDAFELIEAGVKSMEDKLLIQRLAPLIHKRPMKVSPPPAPPEVFRVDGLPRQVYDSLDGERTVSEILVSDDAIRDPTAMGQILYLLIECGMARIER